MTTLPIVSDRAIIARAWGCEAGELMQLIYVALGISPPHPGDVPHQYTPAGFTSRGRKVAAMCSCSLFRQVGVSDQEKGPRLFRGLQYFIGDSTGGIGNTQLFGAAIRHGQQPANPPGYCVFGHRGISQAAEFF